MFDRGRLRRETSTRRPALENENLRITGKPWKWAEGERVTDGSVIAMKPGNAGGAKGLLLVTVPTKREARVDDKHTH